MSSSIVRKILSSGCIGALGSKKLYPLGRYLVSPKNLDNPLLYEIVGDRPVDPAGCYFEKLGSDSSGRSIIKFLSNGEVPWIVSSHTPTKDPTVLQNEVDRVARDLRSIHLPTDGVQLYKASVYGEGGTFDPLGVAPTSNQSKILDGSIEESTGFLPIGGSPEEMPEAFQPLQDLLDKMTIWLPEKGETELVYKDELRRIPGCEKPIQVRVPDPDKNRSGYLGDSLHIDRIYKAIQTLPDLTKFVRQLDPNNEDDRRSLVAIHRGYAMLMSAYLLFPAHATRSVESGAFGLARGVTDDHPYASVPSVIGHPLVLASKKLNMIAFLDYANDYSLMSAGKRDPKGDLQIDNLRKLVSFGGTSDEDNFILLHTSIEEKCRDLPRLYVSAIKAAESGDLVRVKGALSSIRQSMQEVNTVRKQMFPKSQWAVYPDFRAFIMGPFSQAGDNPVFKQGVVFEDLEVLRRMGDITDIEVSILGNPNQPYHPKGQSGAEDPMMPSLDGFLQTSYKPNDLTFSRVDFCYNMPQSFREFLFDLSWTTHEMDLRETIMADPDCALEYLGIMQEQFDFRAGHWNYVQQYILKTSGISNKAHATGGTPLNAWIFNQLIQVRDDKADLLKRLVRHVDEGAKFTEDQEKLYFKLLKLAVSNFNVTERQMQVVYPVMGKMKRDGLSEEASRKATHDADMMMRNLWDGVTVPMTERCQRALESISLEKVQAMIMKSALTLFEK